MTETPETETIADQGNGALALGDEVKGLIERGLQKGFLTYEEINDLLPEDAVSPELHHQRSIGRSGHTPGSEVDHREPSCTMYLLY